MIKQKYGGYNKLNENVFITPVRIHEASLHHKVQARFVGSIRALVLELRREELAVQAGDVGDRNLLRALGLAGSRVGAVAESQLVHLGDHRLGAAGTLDAALRQLGQRRHARGDEEHGRTVLAGGGAGSAADAGGGVHRLVGVGLRDQDSVGVGHRVGAHRDEASGLENLVVGRAVDHEVLDDGEGGRTPRLDGDRGAVLELAHVDLARRGTLAGTVGMAVDVQRAHAADTLAAVVVEGHGLLALVYEVVVQDVEHLEERGVGRDVLYLVGLERSLGFSVLLTPYL